MSFIIIAIMLNDSCLIDSAFKPQCFFLRLTSLKIHIALCISRDVNFIYTRESRPLNINFFDDIISESDSEDI